MRDREFIVTQEENLESISRIEDGLPSCRNVNDRYIIRRLIWLCSDKVKAQNLSE